MSRLPEAQCAGRRWRAGPGHVSLRLASEGAGMTGPALHVVCRMTELSRVDASKSTRDDDLRGHT